MQLKKISIPTPRKLNRNSKGDGGEGVSKPKMFKGKYKAKPEFREGWGEGYGYFLEPHKIQRQQLKYSILIQYCERVMQTIIAEYRSLFLRYIDDISAIYHTCKRFVATIIRRDIGASLQYLADISTLRYIYLAIYHRSNISFLRYITAAIYRTACRWICYISL